MRMLIAVWAAKLSAVMGRIIGKKSSSGPGTIALKICPDLIERLAKNIKKDVIVTCGTNGKTTTNNLLYTALTKSGHKVLCNRLGANMLSGIATAFALECDLLGRFEADFACLEVDEASTIKVFDRIKPNYVIMTNLFRDQLDRYGEIDITVSLLKRALEKAGNPALILNGDDPLTAQFGRNYNNAYYYGISEQVLPQTNDTKEGRFCVECGTEMEYDFFHYSQLGSWRCPSCGIKRPKMDFDARNVDLSSGLNFTINGDERVELNYRGFYNIYNILAVYAALEVTKAEHGDFKALLEDYTPQIGRMEEIDLGKPVILNLAKNPAGFNQAIETVLRDGRKKDIIVAINDNANDGRDVSWLWDVDFEKIAHGELNTLTVTGLRLYDMALRFKYSDVKVDNVRKDMKQAIRECLKTDAEVCYILVNYTALFSTENVMLDIKKEIGGGKNG